MNDATLQSYIALGGLFFTAVGLVIVILQLRELSASVRSAAHAAIYERAEHFRSHLMAYPQLRKYFFENADIDRDHDDYERAATVAELYLNYLENILVTKESFGRRNKSSLDRFIAAALSRSPIMRRHLRDRQEFYSNDLLSLLNSAAPVTGAPDAPPIAQSADARS